MIKTFQKAIMLRSKVKNIFVTNKHEGNRNNYSMQRNVCVTLQQKNKICENLILMGDFNMTTSYQNLS